VAAIVVVLLLLLLSLCSGAQSGKMGSGKKRAKQEWNPCT
jgi:hypothetical protein